MVSTAATSTVPCLVWLPRPPSQRHKLPLQSQAAQRWHGTVNPKGSPGNAGFLYGTTSTLSFQSSTFTGWQTIPADFNVHALSALLSPLLSGKSYYLQLSFLNSLKSS